MVFPRLSAVKVPAGGAVASSPPAGKGPVGADRTAGVISRAHGAVGSLEGSRSSSPNRRASRRSGSHNCRRPPRSPRRTSRLAGPGHFHRPTSRPGVSIGPDRATPGRPHAHVGVECREAAASRRHPGRPASRRARRPFQIAQLYSPVLTARKVPLGCSPSTLEGQQARVASARMAQVWYSPALIARTPRAAGSGAVDADGVGVPLGVGAGAPLRAGLGDPPATPDEATATVVGAGNPGDGGRRQQDRAERQRRERPRPPATASRPGSSVHSQLRAHDRSGVGASGIGRGLIARPRAATPRSPPAFGTLVGRDDLAVAERAERCSRSSGAAEFGCLTHACPSSDVYSDGRSGTTRVVAAGITRWPVADRDPARTAGGQALDPRFRKPWPSTSRRGSPRRGSAPPRAYSLVMPRSQGRPAASGVATAADAEALRQGPAQAAQSTPSRDDCKRRLHVSVAIAGHSRRRGASRRAPRRAPGTSDAASPGRGSGRRPGSKSRGRSSARSWRGRCRPVTRLSHPPGNGPGALRPHGPGRVVVRRSVRTRARPGSPVARRRARPSTPGHTLPRPGAGSVARTSASGRPTRPRRRCRGPGAPSSPGRARSDLAWTVRSHVRPSGENHVVNRGPRSLRLQYVPQAT